jgi:acyl carrier protein
MAARMRRHPPADAGIPHHGGHVHIDDITSSVTDIVTDLLEIEYEELDLDRSFHEMGIDSVQIVGLSAELEDRFGVALDPELAYSHDNVRKLSEHLRALLLGSEAGVTT